MKYIFLLIIMVIFFVTKNLQAQNIKYNDDYQQWLGLKLMYNPTKKLAISAQYVCRTTEFLQSFIASYYYLQGRYKLTKHWYPDMQIRVVDNHDGNLFRLELGTTYRFHKHKNYFSYRSGYFNERKILTTDKNLNNIPADNQNFIPTHYWRNRIGYKRDLPKKFTGYTSFEIYSQYEYGKFSIKRTAFIAGLDYEFKKNHVANIEYLYQPDYHSINRVHLQSITIGYEYDIPKHKHKKDNTEKKERFKDN